jgi:hypothetical protein
MHGKHAGRLAAGREVDQISRVGHRQHAEDAAGHDAVIAHSGQNQKSNAPSRHIRADVSPTLPGRLPINSRPKV